MGEWLDLGGDPQGQLLGDLAGGSALVTPCGPESHHRGGVWGALWSSGTEDSCIIGSEELKRRHGFPLRRHMKLGVYPL